MSREIVFRGQTKDGEWVAGYVVSVNSYLNYNKRLTLIIPNTATLYPRNEIDYIIEVRTETVSQFTGLLDKNGIRVFEGDILRIDDKSLAYVDFSDDCMFTWECVDCIYGTYRNALRNDSQKYEIVGNIWDNPDLVIR